jgi:hypothetical protein
MSDAEEPSGETNPDHREAGREVKDFAKALRHGFPISDEYREFGMKAIRRLLESKSERNVGNALRALALFNEQNIKAEKLELQKLAMGAKAPTPAENNEPAAIREAIRQLDAEAKKAIEDRERDRLAAAYSGALRDARERGEMAAGPAPPEDRP